MLFYIKNIYYFTFAKMIFFIRFFLECLKIQFLFFQIINLNNQLELIFRFFCCKILLGRHMKGQNVHLEF